MGIDIAFTFSELPISAEAIAACLEFERSSVRELVLVSGLPTVRSGQKYFFSLWTDSDIDLTALNRELSKAAGKLCTAWKSEHGGVAGVVVCDSGREVHNQSSDNDEYLYLPKSGFEAAYRIELPLDEIDVIAFPELLLGDAVLVQRVLRSGTDVDITQLPQEDLTLLVEGDLEVEPVLPE